MMKAIYQYTMMRRKIRRYAGMHARYAAIPYGYRLPMSVDERRIVFDAWIAHFREWHPFVVVNV